MFKKMKALKLQLAEKIVEYSHLKDELRAIRSNVGFIEFSPAGEVLQVNHLFLKVVGYTEDEVVGAHHRKFCDKRYVQTPEYKQFWQNLARGIAQSGTFKRLSKQGQVI